MATVRPVPDSEIKVEVWLPAEGWNGRLEALGNGGFSSNIQYNALAQGLAQGYATTGTNTGFDGNDSSFSIGHPEKIKDWGNRAVHEMALTAKAIIAAHEAGGKVDRTRPLCPYPQVAKYKGTGSIDEAANFVCAAP